jgi:type II secretory pathway component PulF
MPSFAYTARNREGRTITDVLDAPSREAVGQMLRSQGLLPTAIVEKRSGSLNFNDLFRKIFSHVSLLEKLTFINNLSVTIKAGLPVAKAIHVLSKQMPNPYFQSVVATIAHDVETGKTLSESMEAFPKVFSPMLTNMVKVGEETGNLDETLEYLGVQIDRDYNLLRRTRGALMYPAVVLVALVIIGYLMFAFVLPKLTASFKEFNTQLPLLTVVIIRVVDIMSKY